MGRDIYWVVERLHTDGTWESTLSQFGEYVRNGGPYGTKLDLDDPGVFFSMRDDYFFEALTDFDGWGIETVAHPELPDDVSDYAAHHLGWQDVVDAHERNLKLFNHGSCSLGRLRDAVAGRLDIPSFKSEKNYKALESRANILEVLIDRDKKQPQILRGKSINQADGMFNPDMVNMSSHQSIILAERSQSFLPIEGETVRFLIAYDS